MRHSSIWISTLLFLLVSTAGILQAHKLEVSLTQDSPVVIIQAGYAGHNHSLSGGDVFIYAPGETKKPYQTGKTDSSGQFAFLPRRSGDWKVVVDDGTGHRSEQALSLGEDFFSKEKTAAESEESQESGGSLETLKEEIDQEPEAAPSQAKIPVLWKVLVGVSLLFGLAGILYGVKARKKSG
jgi:nickel transport protein